MEISEGGGGILVKKKSLLWGRYGYCVELDDNILLFLKFISITINVFFESTIFSFMLCKKRW